MMMLYVIISEDVVDFLLLCKIVWFDYIVCLEWLCDQGCLILVGLLLVVDSEDFGDVGFSGFLVVVEFELLQVVCDWVDVDFYVVVGVYVYVQVKFFKVVLF